MFNNNIGSELQHRVRLVTPFLMRLLHEITFHWNQRVMCWVCEQWTVNVCNSSSLHGWEVGLLILPLHKVTANVRYDTSRSMYSLNATHYKSYKSYFYTYDYIVRQAFNTRTMRLCLTEMHSYEKYVRVEYEKGPGNKAERETCAKHRCAEPCWLNYCRP